MRRFFGEKVVGAPNPEAIMHRLALVTAKYGLSIMWVPGSRSPVVRRALGTALLHLMIGHALKEITEVPLNVELVAPSGGSSQK